MAPATAVDYRRRVSELMNWLALQGLPHATAAQQDASATDFLNMKWFEGFEIAEGRKFFPLGETHTAAWASMCFRPSPGLRGLPRAGRAWTQARPERRCRDLWLPCWPRR